LTGLGYARRVAVRARGTPGRSAVVETQPAVRHRGDRGRGGQVISRYKTGKHFTLTITNTNLATERRQDRTDAEAALDGFYMLRTPVPASQLDDPAVVAAWRRPCAGSGMRVRCGPGTGCSSTGRRRRRHLRRPDRGGAGRGGHRGVQHTQRRAGALDRCRARRRLIRVLHRHRNSLSAGPNQSATAIDERVNAPTQAGP